MNLDRMLEDLEATVSVTNEMANTPEVLLSQSRSATLSFDVREIHVERLLFASNFLLGQSKGRTMAFSYLALGKVQLSTVGAFPGERRKLTFAQWLESLPEQVSLCLTLAGSTRMPPAPLLGVNKSLLFLESQEPGFYATAIPIASILIAEIYAVDNTVHL